jgi:hypothetical protein
VLVKTNAHTLPDSVDNCTGEGEFNDASFNTWTGLDAAKSRVALLVLIKLKRVKLISNGLYRLVMD